MESLSSDVVLALESDFIGRGGFETAAMIVDESFKHIPLNLHKIGVFIETSHAVCDNGTLQQSVWLKAERHRPKHCYKGLLEQLPISWQRRYTAMLPDYDNDDNATI